MADYSPSEIVDLIYVLGQCNNNYYAAARLYRETYPERRHPTSVTIQSLVIRAREGHMQRKKRTISPKEIISTVILGAVAENPHISTRQISREHGIPQSTVSRTLQFHNLHPYHIHLTQQLCRNDSNRRLEFCQWSQKIMQQDPSFFSRVLFTDEAIFNNTGTPNRHNYHYWSNENPHWQRYTEFQHQWSFNVWAGIIDGHVIGPYFFEDTLTGRKYYDFLQNQLNELLENVQLVTRL